MAMLKNIKKNKVTADFSRFTYTISGRPKAGKTSLLYKTAVEKFGNADSLLLVAFEQGYNALNGVSAVDIEEFDEFLELVDELVENKSDLPYRMIGLDTVDIMQDLAIPYVCKKASRRDNKVYKTLSDIPWGGGWNLLSEVIAEPISKLQKAGFSMWFITHDKDKSFETREGLKYDKTTLSLTGKVRDICLNMSDFIIFIELTKEMQDGKLIDKRRIHFRGDSTLECGSRLEHIPDHIDYDIKGFIDAVEGAVLAEYGGDKKKMETAKIEQQVEADKKAQEYIENINKEPQADESVVKEEKLTKIKTNLSKLPMPKLQEIMKKYGIANFNDPSAIDMKALDEILALI